MTKLTSLPPELFEAVLSELPNRDIKNLRLASFSLARAAQLRLDRVFLSTHPLDIRVLNAIAENDDYRTRVVELVYDDARFPRSLETEEDMFFPDIDHPPPEGVPAWYMRKYQRNLEYCQDWKGPFVERPDHREIFRQLEATMSPKESYEQFEKIVDEQEETMAAGSDAKAFEHALERFPNLQRITLTPAAHGIPLLPLYETPMTRSLPDGFIHHIPRGWPKMSPHGDNPDAMP